MSQHLISLEFAGDCWIVTTNHNERPRIGTITTHFERQYKSDFLSSIFEATDEESTSIGDFTDLVSAANALYAVHIMVTA